MTEITRPTKCCRAWRIGPAARRRAHARSQPSWSCVRSQSRPLGDSREPCPYAQGPRKFSCQLEVPEGDNSLYVVSLCVSNSAGSRASSLHTFEGYGIREYAPRAPATRG